MARVPWVVTIHKKICGINTDLYPRTKASAVMLKNNTALQDWIDGLSGGVAFVNFDGASAEKINASAEACVAAIQTGARPVLITGSNNEVFWDCYKGKVDEFIFATFAIDFDEMTVTMMCKHLYKQNGTWVHQNNPFDLV